MAGLFSRWFVTPESVGKQGEKIVEKEIELMNFFSRKGKVIKNVYIPKDNGGTTEIDIVFITYCGIFVLEIKNYLGYIFGDEKNRNWTKTIYRGKNWLGRNKVEKQSFYNPIWQNKLHIKYLQEYLDENIQFFSGIVFSGRCELKDITIDSAETFVCHKDDLPRILKKLMKAYPKILSDREIDEIYRELSFLSNNKELKKEHICASKNIENGKCPRCGAKLVIRTAKKGDNKGNKFYGCSNYPNCKYTRNI